MRFLWITAFTALSALASLAACGEEEGRTDEEPSQSCERTRECGVGFACIGGRCQTRDAYEELGDIYLEGTYVALITDVTNNETCGIESAGADIVYVALETSSGEQRAWGRLIADLPGPPQDIDSTLDGTEPGFNLDCPEFDTENFVSIGCDRSIAVDFLDASGELTAIRPGESLRVFEYGNQCGPNMIEEYYRVELCKDAYAVFDRDVESCTIELTGTFPSTGDNSFRISNVPN
jgi:hypothetical protein